MSDLIVNTVFEVCLLNVALKLYIHVQVPTGIAWFTGSSPRFYHIVYNLIPRLQPPNFYCTVYKCDKKLAPRSGAWERCCQVFVYVLVCLMLKQQWSLLCTIALYQLVIAYLCVGESDTVWTFCCSDMSPGSRKLMWLHEATLSLCIAATQECCFVFLVFAYPASHILCRQHIKSSCVCSLVPGPSLPLLMSVWTWDYTQLLSDHDVGSIL